MGMQRGMAHFSRILREFHAFAPNFTVASSSALEVEPVLGFEPRTDGLQNRCSTTELNWPEAAGENAVKLR